MLWTKTGEKECLLPVILMRQIPINSNSKSLAWCPKIRGQLSRIRERARKGVSLPERLGCQLWLRIGCRSQREAKPSVGVWSPIQGREWWENLILILPWLHCFWSNSFYFSQTFFEVSWTHSIWGSLPNPDHQQTRTRAEFRNWVDRETVSRRERETI